MQHIADKMESDEVDEGLRHKYKQTIEAYNCRGLLKLIEIVLKGKKNNLILQNIQWKY